jgi:hypothetical protein
VEGSVNSGDAGFCQRDVAQLILDRHGQYYLDVKDNQAMLLRDLQAAFEPPFPPHEAARRQTEDDMTATTEQQGGRFEARTFQATTRLNSYLDWPRLAQVYRFERVVKQSGQTTRETAYAIPSTGLEWADDARLLVRWRKHWDNENRSH